MKRTELVVILSGMACIAGTIGYGLLMLSVNVAVTGGENQTYVAGLLRYVLGMQIMMVLSLAVGITAIVLHKQD